MVTQVGVHCDFQAQLEISGHTHLNTPVADGRKAGFLRLHLTSRIYSSFLCLLRKP